MALYGTTVAALLAVAAASAAAVTPLVPVFTSGEPAGNSNYRIPSVVATPDGVIVAFAESRVSDLSDCLPKALVARRSTDGGRTWDALQIVFGNVSALDVVGNPMSVFDGGSGKIVVHFAVGSPFNGCHGAIMQLDDGGSGGRHWGGLLNVSAQIGNLPLLPGPGAGVQLASGRLVMAAAGGAYVDDYIYFSDDGGKNWRLSDPPLPVSGFFSAYVLLACARGVVLCSLFSLSLSLSLSPSLSFSVCVSVCVSAPRTVPGPVLVT